MGKKELFTMGDIDCPKCGKTLVNLEELNEGESVYWCDDCNLEIIIRDGRLGEW